MMRIERVALWQVAMPLRAPFADAHTSRSWRRVVLVRLDAGGLSGWGEAPPVPGYSAETVDDVWSALAGGGGLLGAALADDLGPQPALPATARAALAGALADLRARRDGRPLWRALGGADPVVPAGAVAGRQARPEELCAEVDGYVAAGYRSVKVKIAPGADREWLGAVRTRYPGLALGADGNGSYGRGDLPLLASLDEFGLAYLEQPLPAHDLAGHAELAAASVTPVCLDESIATPADVAAAADAGAAVLVNVKPGRAGGIDAAVALLDAVAAAGLGARPGGMLETGIGRSHLVALATRPGLGLPGDLSASARYFAADLVDPPWTLVDGALVAPDLPGIGVTVDEAAVAGCAERTAVLR